MIPPAEALRHFGIAFGLGCLLGVLYGFVRPLRPRLTALSDLIFLGFGENGHMAFNDPAVADFNDPKMVKIVELDDICRQQQVNDGCFGHISEVPKQAMTLTLSFIMNGPHAICTVPTDRKANAVLGALCGPVTTECPASILRSHNDAALFMDAPAASKLPENI